MKENDPLFELIQSMDKGEKRHFKLHSLKYESAQKSNYIELFDFLESKKEFNRKEFDKKLKGNATLASDKHYLFKQILEALRVYNIDSSVELELRRILDEIEILNNKNLIPPARKLIRQAIKLADETESFNYMLELYDTELMLIRKRGYFDTTEEVLDEILSKQDKTLKKLNNLTQYKALNTKLFYLYNTQGSPKTAEAKKIFSDFLTNPLTASQKNALSKKAAFYYFHINATASFLLGKGKEALSYTTQQLKMLNDSPALVKTMPAQYASVLTNFLIDAANNGKLSEGEYYLDYFKQHIKSILPKRADMDLTFLRSVTSVEFLYKMELRKYDELLKEIPALAEKIAKNETRIDISAMLTYYGNFAFLYFITGDYTSALKWSNKILNRNDKNYKIEIVGFMRLLNLLIYYEFGEAQLIEYISQSVKRYLIKHDAYNEFEQYFISVLRKLATNTAKKERIAMLEAFKTKIVELKEDPTTLGQVVNSFLFLEWVDSKLERKPMLEIINREPLT
jgi:hypothetical protein